MFLHRKAFLPHESPYKIHAVNHALCDGLDDFWCISFNLNLCALPLNCYVLVTTFLSYLICPCGHVLL